MFHYVFPKSPCRVYLRKFDCSSPTNIASVHLVMGCPNAREGVKMVKRREPVEQPNATQVSTPVTNLPLVA